MLNYKGFRLSHLAKKFGFIPTLREWSYLSPVLGDRMYKEWSWLPQIQSGQWRTASLQEEA